MKRKIKSPIAMMVLLFIMLFVTNSCNNLLNNPLEDKETGDKLNLLLLDPNFFNTKFTFHFVDTDGEYITNKDINIYLSGSDANNIVDYDGEKKESFTTSNGKLMLALDPNIEVTENEPIEFTVYTDITDLSYDAFPVDVSYTKEGAYDIIVQLLSTNELKSALINPGWEPFDVKFKNILILNSNDPVWNVARDTYKINGKTYYSIFKSYNTPIGNLSSTNFIGDKNLYSNWGLEGFYVKKAISPTSFSLTNNDISVIENTILFKAYSAIQHNNIKRCATGINISVKEKNGLVGSAKFNYSIWANEEQIAAGKIGSQNIPFTVNTGTFYYPEGTKSVTLKISGDGQYSIEPAETTISNFCGSTVDFVAIPKDGLVPYKLITSITCDDSPIGISPSMSGRYRIKGSNDPWTYFNFEAGICTLQLKPGETYSIESSINDVIAEFDLPTDESAIPQVVEQILSDNEDINDIQYHISNSSKGKEIKIHVFFKSGKCPF